MDLLIDKLRSFLLVRHGILPEKINLDTSFHEELAMSYQDVELMFEFVKSQTNIIFPLNASHHISNFFDMLIFIKIKQFEQDAESSCIKFDPSFGVIEELLANEYLAKI